LCGHCTSLFAILPDWALNIEHIRVII
jgi:hypothetical protein